MTRTFYTGELLHHPEYGDVRYIRLLTDTRARVSTSRGHRTVPLDELEVGQAVEPPCDVEPI